MREKRPPLLPRSVAQIANLACADTGRDTDGCGSVSVTALLREIRRSDKDRIPYQIVVLASRKMKTFRLHVIDSVVPFFGLANATLANAFTKSLLQLGWFTMKSTQRFTIAFSLLFVALMSVGCASDCGCSSGTGLFGTNILQGQPIRSTVRSWFAGDSCDTCNTPAGQLSQPYSAACPTCVGGGGGQIFGGAQPLYGTPTVGSSQPTSFSGEFAPQPGPVVGSTTRNFGNFDTGNLGALATPPSL